jgi:phosphoserine aminotransferase
MLGDQTIVCDMSSNFCSRPIDFKKYGVIYAGAQKNVGPAGVCLAFIREDLLGKQKKDTPLLMDWGAFGTAANTFYNTPCCWSIYMAGLNFAYMNKIGGLPYLNELAKKRSSHLYDYIDSSEGYYTNPIEKKYRSRMNIPFRVCCSDEMEAKFLKEAAAENMIELKGHRSVGGCRASVYNAMPFEGVEKLVNFMKTFKESNPKK